MGVNVNYKNKHLNQSPEKELANYAQPTQITPAQRIWDSELLNAWKLDKELSCAAIRFLERIDHKLYKSTVHTPEIWPAIYDKFTAHAIKRCGFEFRIAGEKTIKNEYSLRIKASLYIRLACPKLHNVILGGKYQLEELLPYMDRFTFATKMPVDKYAKERRKRKVQKHQKYISTRHLGKREHDKNHDWKTVK